MRRFITVLVLAVLVVGCGGSDGTDEAADTGGVTSDTGDTADDGDDSEDMDDAGSDTSGEAAAESSVTPVGELAVPDGFSESEYNGPEQQGAATSYALSGTDPEAAMNAPPGADAEALVDAGLESEATVRFARPAGDDGREDAIVVTQATFADADAAAEVFERYRAQAEAKNDGYADGPIDGSFEWENPAMVQIDPSGEQVGPTPSAQGMAILRGHTIVVLDVFFADEAAADPAVTSSLLDQVLGA